MARYSNIPILPSNGDLPRRYINLKYPEIPAEFSDIYVYTTRGDRYDTLALTYYSDTTLWWVISRSNPSQPNDTLYPNVGAQIRIPAPSRIPQLISAFQNLNSI